MAFMVIELVGKKKYHQSKFNPSSNHGGFGGLRVTSKVRLIITADSGILTFSRRISQDEYHYQL